MVAMVIPGALRSCFVRFLALLLGCMPACAQVQRELPPVRMGGGTVAPDPVAQLSTQTWATLPNILARIVPPTFPDRQFSITNFGAVPGGPDCSDAFLDAVSACHRAGGGAVLVPEGTFQTGPIHLKSGVNLHLLKGATIRFSADPKKYLPVVFTRYEGMECFNYSPLIYAYEQENVAVTGSGTLDGQAGNENWWAWKGRRDAPQGAPNQKPARDLLMKLVNDDAPIGERRFGERGFLRPAFIQFYRCRNVLIEGVSIRRSPMWEVNPVLCTNVTVRGLDIVSHGPNNDGCDPEACRDVLIEKCLFDTGDDCIAIKSGRNNDGRRIGVPSENLVIRNCTMKDGHAGVAIGSEISGGCSNVFIENCAMDSPNLDRALRLKSNAVRGGIVQNVFMRNVTVGRVADAVLQIDFLYEEGAKGPYLPVARDVLIQDITVANTPRICNIRGFPGAEIAGVRILNSTFQKVSGTDLIQDAQDVKILRCRIGEE